MTLEFRVNGRIGRPVAEVFDAVVNPEKLSGYFTTIGGASAPLIDPAPHRSSVDRQQSGERPG